MTDRLSGCHAVLVERYKALAADFAAENVPWTLLVTRGVATAAQQIALHAQGREDLQTVNALRYAANMAPLRPEENHVTVTDRDGVARPSEHQKGRAVDVVPTTDPDGQGPMKPVVDWENRAMFRALGPLALKHGLVWGGTWHRQDMPHLELPPDVA